MTPTRHQQAGALLEFFQQIAPRLESLDPSTAGQLDDEALCTLTKLVENASRLITATLSANLGATVTSLKSPMWRR